MRSTPLPRRPYSLVTAVLLLLLLLLHVGRRWTPAPRSSLR